MSFMLNTAFTLMVLTALFLLFGLIKPKWVLFWMKNPDRIWVLTMTALLFMGSMTLFGEANRRIREAQAQHAGAPQPAAVQSIPAK
jgi:hypothetical protein